MDLVPGAVTYFWFTPIRTGTFDILCFELCGVGHHAMRGQVVVESESAFNTWLGEQETFAQTMAQSSSGAGDEIKLAVHTDDTNAAIQDLADRAYTRTVDESTESAVLEEIDREVDFERLETVLMEEGIEKFAAPQHGSTAGHA